MEYHTEKLRLSQEMTQRAIFLCANDARYQHLAGQLKIINQLESEVNT